MKIVNVYDLLERLEKFYSDNDFISDKELEFIFNECFDCESYLQNNYIK